jgi:hypothetical protein
MSGRASPRTWRQRSRLGHGVPLAPRPANARVAGANPFRVGEGLQGGGKAEMKKQRPVGDARRKSGSSGPALKSQPPQLYAICITTFAPEPYELLRPISIVIEGQTEGFTASFVEANINAFGKTEHEATNMVKDTILMAYERLVSKDDETLRPGPLKQKQILISVIREK